jgi:hypothetical protein
LIDAHLNLAQVAMQVVMDGYRLEEPVGCVPGMYAIMQRCWIEAVSERASIANVEMALLELQANVDKLDSYWVPIV